MKISGIFANYTNLNRINNFNFVGKKTNNVKMDDSMHFPPTLGEVLDVFVKQTDEKQADETALEKQADKVSRLYYKSGNVSCETIYKDDEPYKESWFDFNGKAHWVRYYDESFNLSRNSWHDWKKAPEMELTRKKDGKWMRLNAKPAVKAKDGSSGEVGGYSLTIMENGEYSLRPALYVHPDGTYHDYGEKHLSELKEALTELSDIISSDEYRDDFGGSYKFNNGLKGAIRYIEKKEQKNKHSS